MITILSTKSKTSLAMRSYGTIAVYTDIQTPMETDLFVRWGSRKDVPVTCKKELNEGQLAVMRNLTDPNYVEGETKASKLPDDEKTKLYIREILLSPLTYDIFKQLAKHAQ